MMNLKKGLVAVAALAMTAAPVVAGPIATFSLRDHPDGNQNPPPYGIRLDNLFSANSYVGAAGGATTFSFDTFGNVKLTVSDVGGGVLNINISGDVYGGEDSGGGYGFGAGKYALNMDYTANVMSKGTGWIVTASGSGSGTLTASGNYGTVSSGDTFYFEGQGTQSNNGTGNMTANFAFLESGWRLGGGDAWVGIGWLDITDSGGNSLNAGGTSDFLFTVIPLPGTAGLAMAGLGLIAVRRRR